MSQYNTRINITIPHDLLNRLDEYAKHAYDTRSGIVRLALIEWLKIEQGQKEHKAEQLKRLLSAQQVVVLRQYQRGELGFADLDEADINSDIYLKLLELGEL